MLCFYDREEGQEAYISNDMTGAEVMIDEEEELLLGKLFIEIDGSAVREEVKEPLKQSLLRVLFLGG